ncbi:hypothetical protein JIR001_31170 [Polycladomyces abyssicola]|uniref:Uncharacterized protein n=1 Tax=Polycladomyces abyssicola TaxID=1125966 RepID=A0A8D5UJJ3_9BACL|nr:hypothetical protein [Polycladomyces abyssicola]BCU83334.1 hypothetical protein JIR001_31170 [Polycladomyces abyssicola]
MAKGIFFQCDNCGDVERRVTDNLPSGWISMKLEMPDEDKVGTYWEVFHACSHECVLRILDKQEAEIEELHKYWRVK